MPTLSTCEYPQKKALFTILLGFQELYLLEMRQMGGGDCNIIRMIVLLLGRKVF